MENIKNKIIVGLIGLLVLLNIISWDEVSRLSSGNDLMVDFLNVGQGDSIFITTPGNQQILIDGGPDSTVLEKLSKEMPVYDKTIELIVLTHPEKDHLAGLLDVLRRYRVKNILWTGIVKNTAEWQEWDRLIKEEGANIKIAEAGDRVVLQKDNPTIFFDILNPGEDLSGREFEDSNDTATVLCLTVGEKKFLFTGDIGFGVENQLIKENIVADVLKVAHHGSKYSTSEEFLKQLSPNVAVISVGQNTYGHPTDELLARLNNFGIDIKRTDRDGDIKIFSNGEIITYK